ncbi:helix-turn-helix domain-containing protein [Sungkyunkwania multivorans]|uniref:Helix-turn-helix domain-containing protein n=1 Tax=Sungkyunkwania multivorans TaxID=1173618 RepID=A0ABW3CXT8_9FLAO
MLENSGSRRNKSLYHARHLVICSLFISSAWSQEAPSASLTQKSYAELQEKIDEYIAAKTTNAILYSNAFLKKAIEEENTSRIVDAYENFSNRYSHTPLAIEYADSMVFYAKKAKDEDKLSKSYLQKGIQLYYNSEYNQALENFVLANDLAIRNEDIIKQITVKHYVGLLKNVSKDYKESLDIFRKNVSSIEDLGLQRSERKQYLRSLYALADSYSKNSLLDSAQIFNDAGIQLSLSYKDQYLYPHFLTGYGITSYYMGENDEIIDSLRKRAVVIDDGKKELSKASLYEEAIDSLQKASTILGDDKKNLSNTYLYIAKAYEKSKDVAQAIRYLKKVDSIYQTEPEVIYNAKDAYEMLVKLYRNNDDTESQLWALNKFITADSIINDDFKNLNKQIVKKYESPMLLMEKERLIKKLENDKLRSKSLLGVVLIVAVLALLLLFYALRKNYVYKKRFKQLIDSENNEKDQLANYSGTQKATKTKESLDLPEDLVQDVLKKLNKFEQSAKFVDSKYSLHRLAKELGTNSTYLSKIINHSKQMNFSNYINNIRVNYAVSKLKNDHLFRSYTIKAIANEVGFRNAESFSKAFYNKNGIYPSYFIKKLEGMS